jgi:hypothetical protein
MGKDEWVIAVLGTQAGAQEAGKRASEEESDGKKPEWNGKSGIDPQAGNKNTQQGGSIPEVKGWHDRNGAQKEKVDSCTREAVINQLSQIEQEDVGPQENKGARVNQHGY